MLQKSCSDHIRKGYLSPGWPQRHQRAVVGHCLTARVCARRGTTSRAWAQMPVLLESLAAGPGLGRTFAQAHSFSMVIWGKLSLLCSNACFPEVGWRR